MLSVRRALCCLRTAVSSTLSFSSEANQKDMQTKTKIFIIEHHPDNGRFLTQYLREQGYDTIWSQRAETVVEDCRHFKPDVIILEMRVSGNCGMEVLEKLTAEVAQLQLGTQIICMSVESSQAQIDLCRQMGAATYLIKPFDNPFLGKIINQVGKPATLPAVAAVSSLRSSLAAAAGTGH